MKNLPKTRDEICQLIPQREPFILVDSILEFTENKIVGGFTITADHILVNKEGQLIEAGIIEHFAQTIALFQGYDYFLKNQPAPVGYIGSIKNIEIFELPEIGKQLITHVDILNQMLGVTMVKGEVTVDGKVIAKGEMRTVVVSEMKESGLK